MLFSTFSAGFLDKSLKNPGISAFALTFFCRFSADIYGVYMDPIWRCLRIYDSVQYIYDAYLVFVLLPYIAHIWVLPWHCYHIYDSVQYIFSIYMILYVIYVVHIWRIYGPHLAAAFIYIIQYNPYMDLPSLHSRIYDSVQSIFIIYIQFCTIYIQSIYSKNQPVLAWRPTDFLLLNVALPDIPGIADIF